MVKLLLIDEDAIFRLGLRTGVADIPDLQLVAEAASVAEVWELLENPFLAASIDLVVLDLELGAIDFAPPVVLYPQIQEQYPELPLFLLTAAPDSDRLSVARQSGVQGYCRKGTSLERLSVAFREVAAGRIYWQTFLTAPTPLSPVRDAGWESRSLARHYPKWLSDVQARGLHYIGDDLGRITHQLQNTQLSPLDRLVLGGCRRELRVASWVVRHILPAPDRRSRSLTSPQTRLETHIDRPNLVPSVSPVVVRSADAMSSDSQSLQAILLDNTLSKLQSNLVNLSQETLELDIFRSDKKRELLYTVLREVENMLAELRFAEIPPDRLPEKRLELLVDLWQSSTETFFGKYYTLPLEGRAIRSRQYITSRCRDRPRFYARQNSGC